MANDELTERVQYFNDIAIKYGRQFVPVLTAQNLFEEIVQPTQFGFSTITKSLYGKQVSTDVIHLLKFQAMKGSSYSLWWGVSLAYMPHKWESQIYWHRTLRSARFDLYEEPFEYLNLQAVPWRDEEKYLAHGLYGEVFLRDGLVTLWKALQPSILAWYASAQLYVDIAEKATQQAMRKWIGPRHWPDPLLVSAFTLARSGKIENAKDALNSFLALNTETPEAQRNLKRALLQIFNKESFMGNFLGSQINQPSALRVAANEDQFGEQRGLGVSEITFKVTPKDNDGVFIIENTFHEKGGPAKHLHYDQDEWFYALEGEFILEVGQEKFRLTPGDSILAPRKVPHVWAYTGGERGKILIAFMPAGKMEAFFREVTKANAMPPQDPELWRAHGMELLGPPLTL